MNIYTDALYAFGVCHTVGMLWKEREFLTTAGKEVANGKEIRKLLEAIHLPEQISVIHCVAHTPKKCLGQCHSKSSSQTAGTAFYACDSKSGRTELTRYN